MAKIGTDASENWRKKLKPKVEKKLRTSWKTLPEAQRTQGIESITWIMFLTEINLISFWLKKIIQVTDSIPWVRCASGNVLLFGHSLTPIVQKTHMECSDHLYKHIIIKIMKTTPWKRTLKLFPQAKQGTLLATPQPVTSNLVRSVQFLCTIGVINRKSGQIGKKWGKWP